MRRNIQKSARRSRPQRRSGKRQASHIHLYSRVETVLTTKSVHRRRELYPLAVGSLFNESSVGDDTDIRLVGYTIRLELASGNNTRTVSAAMGHQGPWVRRSGSDGFNQTIPTKPFRNNTLVFAKKVLSSSEREFLSPHKDDANAFVIQLDDPCGVIPGVSIKVTATIHFIRPHLPTMLVDSDKMAVDLYEDQDINGAVPTPPSTKSDVPRTIHYYTLFVPDDINANPVIYRGAGTIAYFQIAPPAGIINVVGQFDTDKSLQPALQNEYDAAGFEGSIKYTIP